MLLQDLCDDFGAKCAVLFARALSQHSTGHKVAGVHAKRVEGNFFISQFHARVKQVAIRVVSDINCDWHILGTPGFVYHKDIAFLHNREPNGRVFGKANSCQIAVKRQLDMRKLLQLLVPVARVRCFFRRPGHQAVHIVVRRRRCIKHELQLVHPGWYRCDLLHFVHEIRQGYVWARVLGAVEAHASLDAVLVNACEHSVHASSIRVKLFHILSRACCFVVLSSRCVFVLRGIRIVQKVLV